MHYLMVMLKCYRILKIIQNLCIKGENVGYKFGRVLVHMTDIWYIDLYFLMMIFVFWGCLDVKLLCLKTYLFNTFEKFQPKNIKIL